MRQAARLHRLAVQHPDRGMDVDVAVDELAGDDVASQCNTRQGPALGPHDALELAVDHLARHPLRIPHHAVDEPAADEHPLGLKDQGVAVDDVCRRMAFAVDPLHDVAGGFDRLLVGDGFALLGRVREAEVIDRRPQTRLRLRDRVQFLARCTDRGHALEEDRGRAQSVLALGLEDDPDAQVFAGIRLGIEPR